MAWFFIIILIIATIISIIIANETKSFTWLKTAIACFLLAAIISFIKVVIINF